MLAQWLGDIVGKLHRNEIAHKDLAAAVGWNPKYLSQVLNGHEKPKGAEEKLNKALDDLIALRQNHNT